MNLFENLMSFTEADSSGRPLTKEEIGKLRKEIVLGSLYTSDYENSFGIDPHSVQDFFDSFIEYAQEETDEPIESKDNAEEIYNYYMYMFDEEPFKISDAESLEEASRQLSPSEFKRFKAVLNKHNPLKNIFVFHTGSPQRHNNTYKLILPIYGAFKEFESKPDFRGQRGDLAANDGIGIRLFYLNIDLIDSSLSIDYWVNDYELDKYIERVKKNSTGSAMEFIDSKTVLEKLKGAIEAAKPELTKLINNSSFTYNLTGKAKRGAAADYDLSLGESLKNLNEDFDPSMPNWLMRAIKINNVQRSQGSHNDPKYQVRLDSMKWTVDKLPDSGTISKVVNNKIFALLLNAKGTDSEAKDYIVYAPSLDIGYDATITINYRERKVSTMSLKALAPYVVEYAYVPDADWERSVVSDKRRDRAASVAGKVDRVPEDERNNWYSDRTIYDKSGYIVNPDKYKTKLAAIKSDNYVQRAQDLFVTLTELYNEVINQPKNKAPKPDSTRYISYYGEDPAAYNRIYKNYTAAVGQYQTAMKAIEAIKDEKSMSSWSSQPAFKDFDNCIAEAEVFIAKAYSELEK